MVMDYRIDPKGKVFTKRVTKRNQSVIAGIGTLTIRGTLHLTPDNRLKDEMNDEEKFIAITNARVYAIGDTKVLYETAVLIVNKSQIAWIFPDESATPDTTTSDEANPT